MNVRLVHIVIFFATPLLNGVLTAEENYEVGLAPKEKRFVFETVEQKRQWEDGLVADLTAFFDRRSEKKKKEITKNNTDRGYSGKQSDDDLSEDKNIDIHAQEIEAEIEEMREEDQKTAYKIHSKWFGRAKGRETKLKTKLKNEEVKVKIRDAAIGYLSRIEKVEKLVLPDWLQDTKLTREQRFLIAGSIHTTKYSTVLHDRLKNVTLDSTNYARCLQEIYGDLSTRFEHYQKSTKIPETEEEWEELYEYLKLYDECDKKALKISLIGFPDPPEESLPGNRQYRYFILLEDVDFAATKPDIEKLFKSAIDPDGIIDIYLVKKFKGLASGYVAVDFITNSTKTDVEMANDLHAYNQQPFNKRQVQARLYKNS